MAGCTQVPSSVHEFNDPDHGADIRRFIQSPGVNAENRVKLFKLAWEMVGSEFAGRHQQYEMFYAGAHLIRRPYLRLQQLRLHRRPRSGAALPRQLPPGHPALSGRTPHMLDLQGFLETHRRELLHRAQAGPPSTMWGP